MLLSNREILRHLYETKAIVIHPFDPRALGNVSFDLTLGDTIARYWPHGGVTDLDEDDPAKMFRLEHAGHERGFLLRAGERVLAHSREIAGGRQVEYGPFYGKVVVAVTTQIHATSTAARIGLSVCQCAGWGDVGYCSPWTLEIQNHSPRALRLPVGAVIAQVSFDEVAPILDGTSYEVNGRYAGYITDDPAAALAAWEPKMMLPKRLKVRP
jgi:dCTP deaminase